MWAHSLREVVVDIFQYLGIKDFAAIRCLVRDRLDLPKGKLEICKRQHAGVSLILVSVMRRINSQILL